MPDILNAGFIWLTGTYRSVAIPSYKKYIFFLVKFVTLRFKPNTNCKKE